MQYQGLDIFGAMKPLRVVFFGTPDFAVESLNAIVESSHQVVGVVTAPDKASGRGQKIHFTAVKNYALEKGLLLFQPEKLKDDAFLKQMQDLQADVFVVVAFRMMPQVLFSIPKKGTFNLHASLLPHYRGAAPINYALINGETTTGVTTFFINERIDEGSILLQQEQEILPEDTAGTLHDKLMHLGARLVVKTLDGISEGVLTPTAQQSVQQPRTAHKIFKADTKIDWNCTAIQLHNFIRGLSPYPAAFTEVMIGEEKRTLKVYAGYVASTSAQGDKKTIERTKDALLIPFPQGIYAVTDLQIEGKKRMKAGDFLNGLAAETLLTRV